MEQNVGDYYVEVWKGNTLYFCKKYRTMGGARRAAWRMSEDGGRWLIKMRYRTVGAVGLYTVESGETVINGAA